MKKGLTELVLILDRSGSMSGLENDTICGYNAMLEKQKKENGEVVSEGTLLNYAVVSETVSCLRASRPISENWKKRIEDDFKKRGSGRKDG